MFGGRPSQEVRLPSVCPMSWGKQSFGALTPRTLAFTSGALGLIAYLPEGVFEDMATAALTDSPRKERKRPVL